MSHWKPISRKGGIVKARDARTGKVRWGYIAKVNGRAYQNTGFLTE